MPRTAPPPPAGTRDEDLAAAPPTFYSLSQLGDHLSSVRWELAAVGAGLVAIGLRDWDWGGSEFQFIEEGWFAKNTPHGGMDKIGHSFSTYVIADILTDRIRANASNPAGAPITGALVAFGIMGLGEAVDGFTGKHRFSREDIVANGVGAAFAILRNSIPGLREKLDWRLMYTPASFERPGITASEESGILPPYQRQRYIMALDFYGRAPLDQQLGEGPVAAADVDPPPTRRRCQPIEEDLAGEPAPDPHHLLIGGAVIKAD